MEATCPTCGHTFRVPKIRFSGNIKCKKCYLLVKVPETKYLREYIAAIVFIVTITLSLFIGFSVNNWNTKGAWNAKGTWTGKGLWAEKLGQGANTMKDVPEKYKSFYSELSFEEFDKIYSAVSQDGQLNDGKVKAEHVGKIMRWTGYVTEVGISEKGPTLYALFRHRPESKNNVTVFFLDSQADQLVKMKKGDLVTYSGMIASPAHNGSNHTLKQGRIIKIR
jgi:hypothetical protein